MTVRMTPRARPEFPRGYLTVFNQSDDPIPPNGVAMIVGQVTDSEDDAFGALIVDLPDTDNMTDGILFNTRTVIQPDDTGVMSLTWPILIAYDDVGDVDSDPAIGDPLGVSAGYFTLNQNRYGFTAITAGVNFLTWVVPQGCTLTTFVKITSTAPEDMSDNGLYYPAMTQFVDPTTGDWVDIEDCWYYDANS